MGWTNKAMEDEIKRCKISIKYYLIRAQFQHDVASPAHFVCRLALTQQHHTSFSNSQSKSAIALLPAQVLAFHRYTTHSTDTHQRCIRINRLGCFTLVAIISTMNFDF